MATVSSTITLVDQMSSKLAEIEGNINSMKDTLSSVSGQQTAIDKFSWSAFLSNAEKAGKRMTEIGKEMTLAITGPLVLLGKKLYGNAVDYEAAFTGMTKTVDGTTEQYEHLNDVVLELSENTPTGYIDLMNIAQTGGNLGVGIDDMETFLRSYSALQAATDEHVSGEGGAQLVADFLNITEGGVQNIEQFGSALVDLGNHFNATEDQILGMGKRMAAAGHLAGLSTPEILGMAAAFRSVGINEEAGGSAASKFIKQMQLSAEVGGQAQQKLAAAGYEFQNALDFSYAVDSMKKADLVDMADKMGMTTEAVKNMADSWVLLDQFAQVSGKTSEQFIQDWSKDPAKSMQDFFYGLNKLGEKGGDSILSTLDKMGLTEIRESNLIAAMASRPELFQSAIETAMQAYMQNTAMWEEFDKQTGTQAAKNEMLGNKLNNSMADLGGNLVEALQPALDIVNQLLDKFNQLSEADQTNIINAFAAFALGGPIVTAIGATLTSLSKMVTLIGTIKSKITGAGGLSAVLGSPVTWGLAAGAGLFLLVDYLDSIPSKLESVAAGAKDIPITVDEGTVSETLSKIAEVQAALDGLKAGETRPEYENTSAAVAYGYGTQDMFATAMAYESTKANANINQLTSDYAEKMKAAEEEIVKYHNEGKEDLAQAAKTRYENLRTELDRQVADTKRQYSEKMSELFNGMAAQYPEAAEALTNAAADYDVAASLAKVTRFDWNAYGDEMAAEAAHSNLMHNFLTNAFNAGYLKDTGYLNLDSLISDFDSGSLNGSLLIDTVSDALAESMQQNMQAVSDNPILSTLLASMLSDPSLTENLDLGSVNGVMEGLVKTLDFKNACEQAGEDPSQWGAYLSEGLAQGIDVSAGVPVASGSAMGQGTINAIKAALGVASPSTFMIAAGMNVSTGLAMGMEAGMGIAVSVASSMGSAVVAVVTGILSSGTGFGIGSNFGAGIAAGIASSTGSVVAAASALASAATSAVSSALQIHSPSKVTMWQGRMTGEGFALGLRQSESGILRTGENILGGMKDSWNTGVWGMIGSFAQAERQALEDEMNGVEDGVKVNDADIKKIRSFAEREVINHFTTAEVKVEMTNNNNISNDMDIDGIVTRLEDKLSERLEAVAEGVYT